MESLLDDSRRGNWDDELDKSHSEHNCRELLLDDLIDDEWPLGIAFNEEDTCFASSSTTTTSTPIIHAVKIDTSINHKSLPVSSVSLSSPYPTFCSNFSEEPLGDDVNLRPIKKRKRERPRVHLLPHIVKHDIRRLLPQMYINTINSGDTTLYQRFLSKFCVGSCCMIDNMDDSSICQALKEMKPLTVRGLDNVKTIMTKRLFSCSDTVTRVEQSWIRHQLDTPGSTVIAKVELRATFPTEHLVEVPLIPFRLPHFMVDTLRLTGQLPMFIKRLDGATDGQNKQDVNAPFYDVFMKSHFVFHVDNDNRIYRLECHGRLQVHPTSI
eukprot:scaffold760_cov178-Ochromonas_danica.AAC.11